MTNLDQTYILIVEDDSRLGMINRRALKSEGYRVAVAENLERARELLAGEEPDMILLDVKLPDGNGFDFCREIRDKTTAYICFLTSVGGHDGEMEGLLAGGDDYLRKPYSIELLRLRVEKAIAKKKSSSQKIVKGSLTLDIVSTRVFMDGEDLLVTPKEFALLRLFMQKEGEVLTPEFLFENIWNQAAAPGDTAALKYHLSRLRKKLSDSGYTIASEYGAGYCFEKA